MYYHFIYKTDLIKKVLVAKKIPISKAFKKYNAYLKSHKNPNVYFGYFLTKKKKMYGSKQLLKWDSLFRKHSNDLKLIIVFDQKECLGRWEGFEFANCMKYNPSIIYLNTNIFIDLLGNVVLNSVNIVELVKTIMKLPMKAIDKNKKVFSIV